MTQSRRKVKKTKKQRRREVPSNNRRFSLFDAILNRKAVAITFLIGFGIIGVFFAAEFMSSEPLRRGLVEAPASLRIWQAFLYTVITCCFVYFVWKYLHGDKEKDHWSHGVLWLSFLAIGVVYVLSFRPEVLPNGDNAEYMILAKSLVEKGGAYRLDTPNETPNSLASLGLPLLLAPIYALWGFDFIKMKILIMIMGLSCLPLMFGLFRQYHGYQLSALLTIVCVASPYMVSSALPIMTEMPYIFWSLVALLSIHQLVKDQHHPWRYLFLSLIAVLMTYLTRAVGISMLIAFAIYLFLLVPWAKYLGASNWKGLWKNQDFRRLLFVFGPIVLFGGAWQIYQAASGVSQFALFFNADLASNFRANLNSAIWVLPQILFEEEVFRWTNFVLGTSLPPITFIYMVLLLLILFGMFTSVLRGHLVAIYTVLTLTIILFGSYTSAAMVIVRYVTIIIPFLIYFLFIGILRLSNVLLEYFRHPHYRLIGRLIGTLTLAQILLTGFHGNRLNLESSAIGQGPEYYDYIDVAKWSKNNLPDDAYVMAVKPRLFYIYSGKKAGRLTNMGEVYTDQYILDKLDTFKERGVTHIVLDRISGSTRRNIFPLVEENPDLFQTMYLGQTASSSAILKLK